MDEPVDHIARPALPWRAGPSVTECGLNAKSVKTISKEEYQKRLKKIGLRRTMFTTCQTCSQTAENWTTWDEDPRKALGREIEWETRGRWSKRPRGDQLLHELLAIEQLISEHPEQFESFVKASRERAKWLDLLAQKKQGTSQ